MYKRVIFLWIDSGGIYAFAIVQSSIYCDSECNDITLQLVYAAFESFLCIKSVYETKPKRVL